MRTLSSRRALASAVATLSLLTGFCVNAQTGKPSSPDTKVLNARAAAAFGKLPLSFEPNRGQADGKVQFIAHSPNATVYLAGADAYLRTSRFLKDAHGVAQINGTDTVRMHLAGASAPATATPADAQPGTVSYLKGNDKTKWQTGLPTYGAVRLSAVYPGVDLKYYGHQGQLEYDFIVAPNADPSVVKLQFDGANVGIAKNGDLELPGGASTLRFDKPVAYQTIDGKRANVDAAFAMDANREVTFKLGQYDHSRELVIDPTLIYLGTIGTGFQQTDLGQIAVDSAGALYFIGTTNDSTYPVTAGAYQTVCGPDAGLPGQTTYGGTYCSSTGGLTAAYVTKLSADGTQLVYSTYLSGHMGYERGGAIAVDAAGVAYLLGQTASNDFPITADAFQSMCLPNQPPGFRVAPIPPTSQCNNYANGGGTQYTINSPVAFFAKLNATGTGLIYASFLGGSRAVYPTGTGLDANGNWYIAAQTSVVPPANLYGTGGGEVQFPGVTSSGYQTTSLARNSYDNSLEPDDAVVAVSKFSNDGHTLLYGTFLGNTNDDVDIYPTAMSVGANGLAFVGGYTQAVHYPTTAGVPKTTCTQPGSNPAYCQTFDGFAAAIDTTKSGAASLVYSTLLGGTETVQGSNIPNQQVLGVTADSSNNLFVTGYTYDSTFPVPAGGFQTACPNNMGNVSPTTSGYIDRCNSAFLLKLDPTGTKLLAGTFLAEPALRSPGSTGYNVRLDSKGQVYLYGLSNDQSANFPQVGALQPYKGGNQLFISTFTSDLSKLLFSTRFGNPSYVDHSVAVAGGMVLDASDNIYFAGTTTDTMFTGTTGTYNTATTTGQGRHSFFAKLSKVLQPDTTALTITPNPVGSGSSVTYKAVVTGTYQTTPMATGMVTFSATNTTPATVLGTAALDGSGTATLTQAAPASAGTYTVVASYGADTVYDVSTSPAVTLTVNNLKATTTTLTASPSSAKQGQTVTLMAAVAGSGGTPSGTVTFLDGATTLGTANLSGGSATYTTTALSVAAHSITARYSGDTTFGGSTSAAQTVAVSMNSVALGLTAAPAVIVPGASDTLTATLSGATSSTAPTGKVTFYSGTASLGTVNVAGSGATLTTTALPAGTDSVTAVYSGDSLYGSVTSSAQTVVVRAAAATTTTLASSASSISSGSSVTFTATVASAVSSGAPSGTVTFYDGTTSLGTGTVSSGTATYTTSSLTVATHSITAVYSGDGLFLGSTSTALAQTVVAATISLSASPTSLTISRGSTGTATITVTPMGAYSGTLSFSCGSLPTYATCAFSPATLTFSASATAQTTTVTINTRSTTSAMLRSGEGLNGRGSRTQMLAAAFFLPLGLLGLAARRRGALSKAGLLMMAVAMSLGAIGLSGCGGSSAPTVAAGSYTVPVVATVNGSSTTLNLSVTVQ